jgi:hypothetical protein
MGALGNGKLRSAWGKRRSKSRFSVAPAHPVHDKMLNLISELHQMRSKSPPHPGNAVAVRLMEPDCEWPRGSRETRKASCLT